MKLVVETKYNLEDKVIAYFAGEGFRKCRIVDILPPDGFSARYGVARPQYLCRTIESDDDIPTTERFNEKELFTIEELQNKIDIIKENW